MTLKAGQAFLMKHTRAMPGYGVILGFKNDNVMYVNADRIVDDYGVRTLCYDDMGATELDKDNVRLRDCPPPFNNFGIGNAFAIANEIQTVNKSEFAKRNCVVIDNGECISKRDMQEIREHLNSDPPQKQAVRRPDIAKMVRDMTASYRPSFGDGDNDNSKESDDSFGFE